MVCMTQTFLHTLSSTSSSGDASESSFSGEPFTYKWVKWLQTALSVNQVDSNTNITIEHRVTDADMTDFWWHVRLADGKVHVASGKADESISNLVTFTSSRDTARAIASGEKSLQMAFLEGHLRVNGDIRLLLANREALDTLKLAIREGS